MAFCCLPQGEGISWVVLKTDPSPFLSLFKQHAEVFLNSTACAAGQPPPATKAVQGAPSFLAFLKPSVEQPDWSSFTICKARRNVRLHSQASCPAWLEPAWTEAVLEGGKWQMVCHVMAPSAPHAVPEPDRTAGLKR